VLAHSDARILFCEDQEQVDKAIEARERTPNVLKIITFDPRGLRRESDDRLEEWSTFLESGRAYLLENPDWFMERVRACSPDEPSMVVYTSGTTGQPKGALLTGRNALAISDKIVIQMGLGPEDSLLSYLPLCHVAEKIFTYFIPLSSGAVVHFGESIDTVRQDLIEVSPSVFLGVPRIWEKMHATITLKMKDSSWLKRTLFHWATRTGASIRVRRAAGKRGLLDTVRWFVADLVLFRPLQERLGLRRCRLPYSGAAPISADLLTWFHEMGVPIYEGFGQTESAGLITLNLPSAYRLGSVGQCIPGTELALADDGEVMARGPHVFAGYLHNETATAQAIDEQGWLKTGDIGRIDDDGYLYITGRKKEIIITAGGKNLSPEKIENALKMSPYIKEAIAIGDRRKFVSALIQIDLEATGDWATRRELTYTSFEDLTGKAAVSALMESEIKALNERLVRVEQVRSFRLLPKELHQDDGEMTATQKVRRSAVTEKFKDLIETMYGSTHG
jgi:long-chain acyl-CoA synthetase